METVVWLWLYDRRWVFNLKAPCFLKIWSLPLFVNTFFLISLFNYTHNNKDQCYPEFQTWIYVRYVILSLILVGLFLTYKETAYSAITEKTKMTNYKAPSISCKNHKYWVTRNALTSYPGLFLLGLSLINWFWSLYGMNMAYHGYQSDAFIGCGSFMKNIVYANLVVSAIFSLPLVLGLLLIFAFKGLLLLVGVVSPSTLISIRRMVC
jgi:hypothetical protein